MTARKFFSDLLKYADINGQDIIKMYEKGLLTYHEAVTQAIDLYKNHISGADKNVKEWYISAFPDDNLGQDIDSALTFSELYTAMKRQDDFYITLGVGDSIVRERIFTEMSYIFKVTYNDIYDLWLETV